MIRLMRVMALCTAAALAFSCSDSSDSDNDNIDSNINGSGIDSNAETYDTAVSQYGLVTAYAEEDGIHFTMVNPANSRHPNGKHYEVGVGHLGIITSYSDNEVYTELNCDLINGEEKKISFVYPLCEQNKEYTFTAKFEPINKRTMGISEKVTLTAKGGIGQLNYPGRQYGKADAKYDKESRTLTVEVEDANLPLNMENPLVDVCIFTFTGEEWWADDTEYVGGQKVAYKKNDSLITFSIELTEEDAAKLVEGKTFAEYQFTCDVPGCPEATKWRVATYSSLIY